MRGFDRATVVDRLRGQVAAGRAIVGAGAGTGISAKFIERGGADLIIIYNSGRFRMAGHSSMCGLLALGDANQIVMEMGEREVLPVVRDTPVIAGVNGTDPTRRMDTLLTAIRDAGFSGVNNFPTVGLFDGRIRQELEASGMGFEREVEMIQTAHELGLFTIVYVFTPEEAKAMAAVGADAVIAHMGLTVGGSNGMDTDGAFSLEDSVGRVQAIGDAALRENPEVVVLCHGGPIAEPEDAAYVIARTNAVGFVGASSMERLPVEVALTDTTAEFKNIAVGGVA
ncbi:phosphoenolpyruvate hydrolase family protein [Pseudonocardia kujensis]|uniref:phosphoenolpyruvate hydrolase family protein n=1 Tax=Pseudonocardia kujensis TaxID=1128675 RepID=UPI001E301CC1|nr:phosphoenolpyruvate hydrolase family protein [Pseudonocardia kujensis]MCE0763608.1 phosphoenolpyruvate hydrolase family protein [Pseudonocardia kujensis]